MSLLRREKNFPESVHLCATGSAAHNRFVMKSLQDGNSRNILEICEALIPHPHWPFRLERLSVNDLADENVSLFVINRQVKMLTLHV